MPKREIRKRAEGKIRRKEEEGRVMRRRRRKSGERESIQSVKSLSLELFCWLSMKRKERGKTNFFCCCKG